MSNSYSYNTYTGDGVVTNFTCKPFIDKNHIKVYVNGQLKTLDVDYTIADGSTLVSFTSAPASGDAVRLARESNPSTRLTDYSDASLLTADQMDQDANQLFFLTQEALDTASETNLATNKFYTAQVAVPDDPSLGDLWYDINATTLKVYNGTVWEIAAPVSKTLTFEGFGDFYAGTAGYTYVIVPDLNANAMVFLNGVKQVQADDLADVLVSGDYFCDTAFNRVYFPTLTMGDSIEVVLNVSAGYFVQGSVGGGSGGGDGSFSLTYNEDAQKYILTDSSNNVSFVLNDANSGNVPVPTLTDNGDGTFTIDNGMGSTIVLRNGTDGETPQLGIDYYNGADGSFKSFIYQVSATQPARPTGGTFNGSIETFPVGWLDNPTASTSDIEWVSTVTYVHDTITDTWSQASDWSNPSLFYQQGSIGQQGAQGLEGPAGSQGPAGPAGTNGINGVNGADGAAGADGANGADGSSVTITGTLASTADLANETSVLGNGYIIGGNLYVCVSTANGDVNDYTNVGQIQGPAGQQGAQGPAGANGNDGVNGANGNDGVNGAQGAQGVQGPAGSDGSPAYLHTAYATSAVGANIHLTDPNANGLERNYIGVYADQTQADSADPALYTWALFRGVDGVSINWQGDLAANPATPANGYAYYNTTDKKSYIYQDAVWYQLTVDGVDGTNGTDGLVWQGHSLTAPENPATNWAYKDISEGDGKIYIYNGTAWEVLVENGINGVNGAAGTNGSNGVSVFIVYSNSAINVQPSNVPTTNFYGGETTTSNGWTKVASASTNWILQGTSTDNTGLNVTWGNPIRISGKDGLNGTHGSNGAGFYAADMSGNNFTNQRANSAILAQVGRKTVVGDIITLSQVDNRANSVTKRCDEIISGEGSFGETVVLKIDGSVLVNGSITSDHLGVGSIDANRIKANTLTADYLTTNNSDGFDISAVGNAGVDNDAHIYGATIKGAQIVAGSSTSGDIVLKNNDSSFQVKNNGQIVGASLNGFRMKTGSFKSTDDGTMYINFKGDAANNTPTEKFDTEGRFFNRAFNSELDEEGGVGQTQLNLTTFAAVPSYVQLHFDEQSFYDVYDVVADIEDARVITLPPALQGGNLGGEDYYIEANGFSIPPVPNGAHRFKGSLNNSKALNWGEENAYGIVYINDSGYTTMVDYWEWYDSARTKILLPPSVVTRSITQSTYQGDNDDDGDDIVTWDRKTYSFSRPEVTIYQQKAIGVRPIDSTVSADFTNLFAVFVTHLGPSTAWHDQNFTKVDQRDHPNRFMFNRDDAFDGIEYFSYVAIGS